MTSAESSIRDQTSEEISEEIIEEISKDIKDVLQENATDCYIQYTIYSYILVLFD